MAAGNITLSLILIALGFIAVILSFMVPDKKKAMVSLVLGLIIVVGGLVQYTRFMSSQRTVQRQMDRIQQRNQTDLEEIRSRLRERATEANEATRQAVPEPKSR